MPDAALLSLLQCPHCRRAAPAPQGDDLKCPACGVVFPRLIDIPWLFADPARALGDWRNRLTAYLAEFAAAAQRADADLAADLHAVTRERLTRLAGAYREQRRLVADLLAPLTLAERPLAQATQQAFATSLPLSQDLHSYYVNVHRDWAWGNEENERSKDLVATALDGERPRILVLGAGAARLAYDLHQGSTAELTVALDLNPMLLLVARKMLAGEVVKLFEFPLAPRSLGDVAVEHELRAPAPTRPGLSLVLADAWQAPFKPQSFDAVITPWLVDIVDLDFAAIAAHVNRLLAAGGRWVNFGSLAFPWRRPALRLSREELEPALTDAGFRIVTMRDQIVPYMRSPSSRHSRLEEILVFAADKYKRAPRDSQPPALPAWLDSHSLPVPREPPLALAADASRIQAVTLALIDGRRSIDELVRIVCEQRLLPEAEARSAIRGLLERLVLSGEKG
jgi:uncharacterized protein YbaR (Trm112 family)